jgi:hypothetical protein
MKVYDPEYLGLYLLQKRRRKGTLFYFFIYLSTVCNVFVMAVSCFVSNFRVMLRADEEKATDIQI